MSRVLPVGDDALQLWREDPRVSSRLLLEHLRPVPRVRDVVVTEHHALVLAASGELSSLTEQLASAEAACLEDGATTRVPARDVRVRVAYDGEDLDDVASRIGLTRRAVVDLHQGGAYEVAMMGFLPGFAYLRGLDPRLVLARRAVPRPRVPRGAVAIGATYAGIYPSSSPGGWHLLGRAIGFDAFGRDGATLALGDRVRFEECALATDSVAVPSPNALATSGPALVVTKAQGLALVVDRGRFGHMHEGVPESGPLVVASFDIANAAAANPAGAAAIEIYGSIEVAARGGRVIVCDESGGRHVLEDGASLMLAPSRTKRVRYLAVRGGVDVPGVLGSRTTLLAAGLGGLEGRPLRRGDRIPVGTQPELAASRLPHPAQTTHIRLRPGPDADDDTLRELEHGSFVVASASDRTGTRLEAASAASERPHETAPMRPSAPMVLGAVERTPSGFIVLGPDHPTTGGYPLVAVLATASRDAFFDRPVGAAVAFTIG